MKGINFFIIINHSKKKINTNHKPRIRKNKIKKKWQLF